MAIEVEIDVPCAPEVVLDAIREEMREWRESVMPAELRRDGALGVKARFWGSRFRLRYIRGMGDWRRGDPLEVRGVVTPLPDGGCRVYARCGMTFGVEIYFATIGVLACVFWLTDPKHLMVVVILAAVMGFVGWMRDRRVTRETVPEARYLVERLERAVAAARATIALHGRTLPRG